MARLVVQTAQGVVRGKKCLSAKGNFTYFSFQGIPYAKPPIKDLRFKAPQPPEEWEGVRECFQEGPISPSLHMVYNKYLDICNEDCLYLNVYTPTNDQYPKAVMLWIHGGGFNRGSGDSDIYGPDYLVAEDIILVTCNYRLGALGYLSLQNNECPGNFGLKDLVMVLKWIKENISNFGGNPYNVTIFGESAGGAAVGYLMLSKSARGLFHRAISMSGSPLNPWAFATSPRQSAFALGKGLGCASTDDKELLQFLKNVPPKDLVLQTNKPGEKLGLAFVPCVEPEDVEDAFITKSPLELLQLGQIADVPYIVGNCTLEGLIMLAGLPERTIDKDEDYERLIPSKLGVKRGTSESREIASKIKQFYFRNGYSFRQYVEFCSMYFFLEGIQENVQHHIKSCQSPLYYYQFSFDGAMRLLKTVLGYGDMEGTCHGDEIGYLFHVKLTEAELIPNTREYKVVENITKLWTTFAKIGNPNYRFDQHNTTWRPMTKDDNCYLDINSNLEMRKDYMIDQFSFWNDLKKHANSLKGKL